MRKHYKIAALKESQAADIQVLEKTMNVHIMAFEREISLASLRDADLKRIKELEKKLGVVLLVYEK